MKKMILSTMVLSLMTFSALAASSNDCRLAITGLDKVIRKNVNLEISFRESLHKKGIELISSEEVRADDFVISDLLVGSDSSLKIPLPSSEYTFTKKINVLPLQCMFFCGGILETQRELKGRKFKQVFSIQKINDEGQVVVKEKTFRLTTGPMINIDRFDFSEDQEKLVSEIARLVPSCKSLN